MRFNGRELAYLAQNSSHGVDMEGVLQVREKFAGLFRNSKAYVERLFRLRGNLLFYFKTKDSFSEPMGVYVMERCVVELDIEEEKPFSFVLVFEGDADHVLHMVAESEVARDSWIERLHIASYECMQIQLQSLRERLKVQTGRDPIDSPDALPDPPEPSHRLSTSEPILEMSVTCDGLPLELNGRHPTTFVSVQTLLPPQQQWHMYTHTETIEHNNSPKFLTMVTFCDLEDLSPTMRLKLTVNNVKERMTNTVTPLGSAIFTIADLFAATSYRLTLSLRTLDELDAGRITITGWHDGKNLNWEQLDGCISKGAVMRVAPPRSGRPTSLGFSVLQPHYDNVISRTFRLPVSGDQPDEIVVQEYMGESRLTFDLPRQLLSLWVEEEQRKTEELQSLGQLTGELEDVKAEMMDFHLSSISTYSQHMRYLTTYQGAPFKPSSKKGQKEVEFAPTNLHIQRMWVQDKKQTNACYDTVTVGAFTAYAQRFRNGGLRRLLRQQAPDSFCGGPGSGALMNQLASLRDTAHGYCECLCRAAMDGDAATLNNTATALADRVRQLIEVCENTLIEKALADYAEARVPVPPPRPSRDPLRDPSQKTSPQDTWKWSGTDFVKSPTEEPWEMTRLNTEASLVCILCKVEALLRDHQGESSRWLDELSGHTIKLRGCINMLCSRARAALTYTSIQSCRGNVVTAHSIKYRRDVVFAQALTSAATGFVTKLQRSVTDATFLRQLFQLGVLMQFESLLSCHGDDMAMLEDMVVGVNDLAHVTFKVKRATGVDDVLPTVSGNRTGYTVHVPIAPSMFALLPRELQNGHLIKVIPVLFSIGINEQASFAERFGSTALQEEINAESYQRLYEYHEKYMEIIGETQEDVPNTSTHTAELMRHLHINVVAKKSKNVEILHLAAEVCRALGGVRFTSCKSAKDRTAMSVTLEQVQLLQRHHGLCARVVSHTLECMRSEGVRRANTMKNAGAHKYAFNSIQLLSLPRLYRPPGGTYGNVQS